MNPKSHKLKIILVISIMIIFFLSTFICREHLLDDTFIHLRYARNFDDYGILTYNFPNISFGTSSPFYTIILALLGRLIPYSLWPVMAKCISIIFSFLSLIIFLKVINIFNNKVNVVSKVLWSIFTFTLLALPPIVRWLQDGMETSLALFSTILVVYVIKYAKNHNNLNILKILLIAIIIVLPSMVRIELILISLVTFIILLKLIRAKDLLLVFVISSIILVIYYLITFNLGHALISDAGIAKRTNYINYFWVLDSLRALLTIPLVWLFSIIIITVFAFQKVFKNKSIINIQLISLTPLVIVILIGTYLNQYIQGARYFLPFLLFPITIFLISEDSTKFFQLKNYSSATIVLVLILLTSLVQTIYMFEPLNKVLRKDVLNIPEYLTKKNVTIGVADIGQIGWYSNATIFDLGGLVNGREIADAKGKSRLIKTVQKLGIPDYLVINQYELNQLKVYDILQFPISLDSNAIFHNTNKIVMRSYNLNIELVWYLWNK